MDNWASLSLRIGVIVSLALIGIGLVLTSLAETKLVEPAVPPGQLLQSTIELKAAALITNGILALLLTSILPVLIAIVTFLRDRNKLYLGISITVLCILAVSFLLALR